MLAELAGGAAYGAGFEGPPGGPRLPHHVAGYNLQPSPLTIRAVTHNTPDALNAAAAAALMTHYFLSTLGPNQELPVFLQGQVERQWIAPWYGKALGKGWMSVRAAITALVRNMRLTDLLKDCIA